MISLRQTMSALGISTSGNVSVLGSLYGFLYQRVPDDPDPAVTSQLSLRDKLVGITGRYFNINVISVGWDNFSGDERRWIEYAIFRAHGILKAGGLGIGRIGRYHINAADARGRDDIGSDDEAEDLTQEWSVNNDGLDVFVVDNISAGWIGLSPVPGPCDKEAKGMNGLIGGEVNLGALQLARTFSHEMCHYLGLSHNHGDDCPTASSARDNLMAQSRCCNSTRNSTVLTSSQQSTIRTHCAVHNR